MSHQNYKNHIRFYTPHHFVFYPVMGILEAICLYNVYNNESLRAVHIMLAVLVLVIAWLSYMMRQHYALGYQDRIVRLEMRLRYYQLTHTRFETYEDRLSLGQIAALRF